MASQKCSARGGCRAPPCSAEGPSFSRRDGFQVGADAPGGEGAVESGSEHANLGRSRARSASAFFMHLPSSAFCAGSAPRARRLCASCRCSSVAYEAALSGTRTRSSAAVKSWQDGAPSARFCVPAPGYLMHPPAEQFGVASGCSLPALQHAEGILELRWKNAAWREHGVQIRHRTGLLRGHSDARRSRSFLGGGKNSSNARACRTTLNSQWFSFSGR